MTEPKAKIAISVAPDVLALVREAVELGAATSVSAFFERAALLELDADLAFERMLEEIFEETGGPPTAAERAEARAILDGDAP